MEFARGQAGYTDYVLADRLHKTLREIEEMPNDEYVSWIAFYLLEQERGSRR